MKLLFPALEARFNADHALVIAARKLYEGFEGERPKRVKPYVEVSRIGGSDTDTFGHDIDVYILRFSFFTGTQTTDLIHDIFEHMRRVFKYPNLGGNFSLVGSKKVGQSGPFLRDGAYQGQVSYEYKTQRDLNVPLVRHL